MIHLDWKLNPRASIFHAAAGMQAGLAAAHRELPEAIANTLAKTSQTLQAAGIHDQPFWSQILVKSAENDALQAIVSTALRKLYRLESEMGLVNTTLVGCLTEMLHQANPHRITGDELQTRSQPLRQQWEAYGPGLMRLIEDRTIAELIVDSAKVILVQPIFGGAGKAHLLLNAIHLEALLANPRDELPEVLRMAWLLSQLNNDLPVHSDSIPRNRLSRISGLAMLPATLIAAEELGLSRFDQQTLRLAIQHWQIATPEEAQEMAELADRWWSICTSGRYAWNLSLAALDRMVDAEASRD